MAHTIDTSTEKAFFFYVGCGQFQKA